MELMGVLKFSFHLFFLLQKSATTLINTEHCPEKKAISHMSLKSLLNPEKDHS